MVNAVVPAARAEFKRLIPQLPYIGGKGNHLKFNLVSTAWFLALYRALQEHGKDINELGPLLLDIYQAWMDSFPHGCYVCGVGGLSHPSSGGNWRVDLSYRRNGIIPAIGYSPML